MQPWIKDFIIKHRDLPPVEYPALPPGPVPEQFDWILQKSGMPWVEIQDLVVPYSTMLAEAQALRPLFVEHRSGDSLGWLSISIHGVGAAITSRAEDYGMDSTLVKYDWTEIQDRCPVTVEFLKNQFPYNYYQRVRFMLLEAGGYIAPHSDNAMPSLGGAINISLNNPDDCNLVTVKGCVPFRNSGSVFLYDNHYQHSLYNNSNIDRYHMIIHGGWKPEWCKHVVNNYKRILND